MMLGTVCLILAMAGNPAVFPKLEFANLNREKVCMPEGFAGERNLVLIAFLQEQQRDVDTWLARLPDLERRHAGFRFFELPTVSRFSWFGRFFLDNAMRSGIKDRQQRARTITLYIDKEAFKQSLGIETERTIYALLLDRAGTVLWRAEGPWDEAKGKALEAALAH